MQWLALEVSVTLHGAIVLACGLWKHNADPVSGREGRGANELDDSTTAISDLDVLAEFERFGHGRSGMCAATRPEMQSLTLLVLPETSVLCFYLQVLRQRTHRVREQRVNDARTSLNVQPYIQMQPKLSVYIHMQNRGQHFGRVFEIRNSWSTDIRIEKHTKPNENAHHERCWHVKGATLLACVTREPVEMPNRPISLTQHSSSKDADSLESIVHGYHDMVNSRSSIRLSTSGTARSWRCSSSFSLSNS